MRREPRKPRWIRREGFDRTDRMPKTRDKGNPKKGRITAKSIVELVRLFVTDEQSRALLNRCLMQIALYHPASYIRMLARVMEEEAKEEAQATAGFGDKRKR
jgi:hypothetical protein